MLNHARKRNDVRGNQHETALGSKDIDVQLGRRLKLRRTLLGMTQEQVASACGLSYQQVHKYETGQSKLSTSRLIQFSSILSTPVGWFFDGLDCDNADHKDVVDEPIDKATTRLIAHTRQIKSRQRLRQLIDFAKLLAEADAEEAASKE